MELYYSRRENMAKSGFIISPLFLHPKSTGTVTLADANPMSPPVIDPKFLSVEDDVQVYAKGTIRTLTNTTYSYFFRFESLSLLFSSTYYITVKNPKYTVYAV